MRAMAEVGPLLRWLAAHDPYERVIVVCAGLRTPRAGRRDLVVVWDECLGGGACRSSERRGDDDAAGDAPAAPVERAGLAARLLAAGARRVEAVACPGAAPLIDLWVGLTPGLVGRYAACSTHPLRSGEVMRADAVPVPRRDLLRPGASPEPVLDDQAAVMAALHGLEAEGRARVGVEALAGARAQGQRLTAQGCTSCGVCTVACPEGALGLVLAPAPGTGEGQSGASVRGLVHDLEACRSCGACVEACPVAALAPAGRVSLREAWADRHEVLEVQEVKACDHCGNPHPAREGGLCALCSARRRSPFRAELPAEALAQLPASVVAAIRRSRNPVEDSGEAAGLRSRGAGTGLGRRIPR